MQSERKDGECVMTTDANSFIVPQSYPQINSYLRGLAMSSLARSNNNYILIRIHTVGVTCEQLICFKSALNSICNTYRELFNTLQIQYLNNDIIRCNHMTPSQVVKWLLDGHVHILLGHFHQGIY